MSGFTDQSHNNPFVGRASELNFLRQKWRQARQGTGSFVLITGEAGIGKKALVKHFVAEALRESGGILGTATFSHNSSYQPYTPFLDVVSGLQQELSQESRGLESVLNVKDGAGNSSQPDNWDLESLYSLQEERRLVQQHLLSSILLASQQKPVLVELSDMQHASITAWRFLHYLCESVGEHRIMIVANLQQIESVSSGPSELPHTDVLLRMNREGVLNKIELGRLEPADVRNALKLMFPKSDFTSEFMPMLVELADGIPAHLAMLAEIVVAKDLVYEQGEIWFNRDDVERDFLLGLLKEGSKRQPAQKIVGKLTAAARRLLEYAALIPKPIDGGLLVSLVDGRRIHIIRDLAQLVAEQLLQQIDDESFRFGPILTRSALLECMAPETLSTMHRKIAVAIETSDITTGPDKTYRLAHHWSHTDDHEKAFHYLSEAAHLSITNIAFLEARHFIQQAVGFLDTESPATHRHTAVRVLTQAAWLNRILGYWDESQEYCSQARKMIDAGGDERDMAQVLLQEGLTNFRRSEWDQARAALEQTLASRTRLSLFDQAMVLNGLGSLYFETSDYDKADKCLEEALGLANSAQAARLKGNIINSLGALKNVRGNHMQAIALYSQCIPLFEGLGDLPGMAKVYHNIGMTYADECNWDEANQFYGKSLKVSDEMGLVPLKSMTFLNRAMALVHLKKYDDAREYNFKAHRLLQRLGDSLGLAEYHKIQGVIERHDGCWEKAACHLEAASEQFAGLRNQLGSAETAYELGQLAIETGAHDTATMWLRQAMQSYSELRLADKVAMVETALQDLNKTKQPLAQTPEANS